MPSSSDRNARKKEKRRNKIINAAETLFFSKGYENVSLDEIARKVDLGRSTLYLYFENKEELFFAIVLRGTVILYSLIKEETQKAKTGVEKLAAFRKAYYEFAKTYPDYLKIYNYLLSGRFDLSSLNNAEYKIGHIEHSKYYSEYKKLIEDCGSLANFPIPKFTLSQYLNEILNLRREMLNILCNIIKQGINEGNIRSDVNPVEATALLTLIANSLDNMPPDLENLLESHDITHEEFLMDVGDFIGHMVSSKVSKKLI
ncbi:TetR/AcrR family transcriptional regulator [Methanobacterium sp.]|uniref:TetR/AcrR family transcriptional regulator n=1 Tax=Methanobacterium sp. TaxID=2164 RepID=UPI0025F77BD6|nr:TetR/AcrR family transcriptional regulator [Methanobacterium sp.]MBI5459482.1 TetR/AcrR family transcriptional regulator [Methanobacterium sp.]